MDERAKPGKGGKGGPRHLHRLSDLRHTGMAEKSA